MAFEELLKEIKRISGGRFPEAALMQLPLVVSPRVQKKILSSGKSPEKLAEIFLKTIDIINRGSVERVEKLIERALASGK